jgi:hypothetical protein
LISDFGENPIFDFGEIPMFPKSRFSILVKSIFSTNVVASRFSLWRWPPVQNRSPERFETQVPAAYFMK